MAGRSENSIKFNKNIEDILQNFPDFAIEWARNMEAGGKTGQTRVVFVRIIRRYLRFVDRDTKGIEPDQLNVRKTQEYLISIKKTSSSDSYQQQVWCCLNNFFKYLVMSGYKEGNPMEIIDKTKNHDLDRINHNRLLLTENDFNKILGEIKKEKDYKFQNRDMAVILIFMYTGIRKTALSEIDIDDIDFENRVLKVIDKGNKYQVYPLDDEILGVIRLWMTERIQYKLDKTNALFVSRIGTRITGTTIDNIVAKYSLEALGKKISPHKLRAGFVSIYYNKTKDIEATRRAVGHSNIATTQRYIVTDNKERQDAISYMSSFLKF